MEQYGNTSTYNMESVLRKNVVDSEYYRDTCLKLTTWGEVVDEIFYSVTDVEPWMSGNARGASTAFCLLHRLFTIVPTQQEVKDLLDHVDSPYIRAVGFLYLRYVGNPRMLWDWIQPYVKDHEEISPSPEGDGRTVSMGEFVRDVFLEQYYFETIFPRIPKLVQDQFETKLTAMGLPSKAVGNAGQGGADRRGIEEANRRPASVKASLSVALGQRAPNRAAAREEGRGLGAGMKGAPGQGIHRSSESHKDKDKERERRPENHRDKDRDRDRDRNRERSAERRREPDRDRGRPKDYRADRDRDRDRHRDRDGGHRHRDYDEQDHRRDRDRDRDSGKHRR